MGEPARINLTGPAITYRYLTYTLDLPLATVTLNRPGDRNRIDGPLAEEIREACQAIREDERVTVVIVTGSGECFSVGREPMPPEIARLGPDDRLAWIRRHQVASAVASLPGPVIVAINGDAIDHGLELALAGDLRVAAHDTRFGLAGLGEGSNGFPWDGGTQRLPRLVGVAWARDLLLTGRTIDSAQALQLGLVNRVAPAGEPFREEVRKLAEAVARGGPVAARYAKEAVAQGADLPLAQGLRLEADLNIILQSTRDRAEGLRSFLEKRPPVYTGC